MDSPAEIKQLKRGLDNESARSRCSDDVASICCERTAEGSVVSRSRNSHHLFSRSSRRRPALQRRNYTRTHTPWREQRCDFRRECSLLTGKVQLRQHVFTELQGGQQHSSHYRRARIPWNLGIWYLRCQEIRRENEPEAFASHCSYRANVRCSRISEHSRSQNWILTPSAYE